MPHRLPAPPRMRIRHRQIPHTVLRHIPRRPSTLRRHPQRDLRQITGVLPIPRPDHQTNEIPRPNLLTLHRRRLHQLPALRHPRPQHQPRRPSPQLQRPTHPVPAIKMRIPNRPRHPHFPHLRRPPRRNRRTLRRRVHRQTLRPHRPGNPNGLSRRIRNHTQRIRTAPAAQLHPARLRLHFPRHQFRRRPSPRQPQPRR